MVKSRARLSRVGVVVLASTLVVLALAGCNPGSSAAPSAAPPTSATPTPTATPVADPELIPGGSAKVNLPYFDFINRRLFALTPTGNAIVDNLVAGGFAKADIEVTEDETASGLAVDSYQFSVRISGECLIGQLGSLGYHSLAAPLLGTGKCLVGKTRTIDW